MGFGPASSGDLATLAARLALDLVMTALVLHGVYFRLYRRREHVFTCYLFNVVTLCLCVLLRKGPADLGFALTLFGVFGILRYRTEQIRSRDLTYLFIVIGLGLINGASGSAVSLAEALVVNGVVVGLTALLELGLRGGREQATPMCYDRLDLLRPGNEAALVADVAARTGLVVTRVETDRFDMLRDVAEVTVYARRVTSMLLAVTLTAMASPGFAAQTLAPPVAQAASVTGQILDAGTTAPVSRADVRVTGTGLTATTDNEGRFTIAAVPPGTYSLAVTRVGYEALQRDAVHVTPGARVTLALELRRLVTLLETVTVTPGAFSFMDDGSSTRQTMSREDIESVPQLGEDIFRAVNRLPGLSSGDYSAHFSIRGGRHDETLIQLDGLELYEPYHLKDFNEGAISIIDTQTVDGVELLTGGFPAKYGNKRSGVMNITSRTPESDHARYSAGVSLMNARVMGRGPLWDGQGSWLLSARSGYMDLVFGLINQNQLPSPRYQDVFGKLQRSFGARTVVTFDVLHASDTYTFDAASTTGFEDSLRTQENAKNRYGNSYLWTTIDSSLGRRTTVKTLLAGALVTRSRDGAERYIDLNNRPLYSLSNSRDYGILQARQDWRVKVSDRFIVDAGFDLRRLSNTDTFQNIVNEDPDDPLVNKVGYPLITNTRFEKSGSRFGVFVSNRWRVARPLTLEFGGRYDRASYTGDRTFSPRTGAALELGRGRTLRAGWGEYWQTQGIDEVAALNDRGRFFPAELSRQWTVGLEQTFAEGTTLRVEGYLKDGSHLRPVYRNWKNAPDVFPETNEDRILVYPRASSASGLELYFARALGRRLNLNASYALSTSEEQVDRIVNVNAPHAVQFALTHPTPQDQRHAAHLDLTYRVSSWSINTSLAYHSGWPGTLEELVNARDADGDPVTALRPITIYGSRLPTYFRTDVRATKRWAHWNAFVELVNLTNHSNVFGYDYYRVREPGGRIGFTRNDEQWFTILPSIGVSWNTRF